MLHADHDGAPVEILGPEAQAHMLGEHPDTNVIGSAFVFERPAGESVEDLTRRVKERVLSRLDLEPRFRARAMRIPDSDHVYALVHDQPVDIDAHVSVLAADEIVDETRLHQLCLAVMEQPLAMNRPLWQITIIPRVTDDRAAVVVKIHHFIEDGVLAIATMTGLLIDASPDAPLRQAEPWPIKPLPSVETLQEYSRDKKHPAESIVHHHLGLHPRQAVNHIEELLHVYRSELRVTPSDVLTRVSEDRGIAVIVAGLDEVKKCQELLGHHVSVNDVVVTITVMALQNLLEGTDRDGQRILIDVPVSLSLQTDGAAGFDNYAAMMILDVPLDEPDPLQVLKIVSEQSREKKTTDAWAMAKIMHAVSLLPLKEFKKMSARLWSRGNFMFSNLPGPSTPIFVAHGKVTQWIGLGQLRGHAALRVIVLSYAGNIAWSVTYDRRVLDGQALEDALRGALQRLRTADRAENKE